MASLFPFIMLMMNLTTIVIVWFGGLGMASGAIKVGSLMAFIQYTTQIMFSVVMVSVIFVMVPRASVSAGRINDVLTLESEIKDPPHPEKNLSGAGVVEFRHRQFQLRRGRGTGFKGYKLYRQAGHHHRHHRRYRNG